ncbi:hypothetical protein [Halomicrobium katesii]|uniref:hypothetical protein n=1 Tax=Halomicrobium katesii TaxID=437163 RepID=UPI000371BB07|nr:hypothetical protein [Halomicrobium katesii]
MGTHDSGDGWTVEVDDSVMVWEFLPGMELDTFGTEAFETYERLLDRGDISAMVTVVKLDDPFSPDVFEVWERSAVRAEEAGVDRWAVVADGIKAISLRGKVDTGELETLTTEDRSEAVEWAKSG